MKNLHSSTPTMSVTKRALQALKQSQEKLAAWERTKHEPIAVIGMGCRFPGGIENAEDFQRLLAEGRDAIGPVPHDRWDMEAYFHPEPGTPGKMSSREGGFLTALDQFDPQFFNISPVEAKSMDPQQRFLLEVAWEALEHAGQAPNRLFGSQTGVFVGMCNFDFATQMGKLLTAEEMSTYAGTGGAPSVVAGRLSYVFGLTGPSMVVDTACSSSLVSTDLACRSLRNGECDMALAAGVNLIFSPETSVNFSRTGMLSVDSRCKTFAASANGYVRSEGCGVIILKRLSDALADGDRILAQIAGSAVNQDGPSGGLTVPNGVSQERVIRMALGNAKVEPSQIDYIEAHGTGTSLGDPIEIEALGRIFAKDRQAGRPLVVGSVKTNIGHGEAAAGIAGIIKVVLAMNGETIPRHLHLDEPNPHIPWDELPIKIPLEATPWRRSERPRLAGVSSFGFSGTNAHVILKESPLADKPVVEKERPLHLLALSAKNEAALKVLAERYIARLERSDETEFANLCSTANVGRTHFRHRLCGFADSPQEMRETLQAFIKGEPTPSLLQGELRREQTPPKPVFMFTGQGSQFVDMGRELFESQPTFRKSLIQCAEILADHMDQPLLEVLFPQDESALIHETVYAQPALFALEYALAQLLMAWGVRPAAVLGHSVGELTAACVAGVFSLEDGLRLIAKRGQVLQALPKTGSMRVVFASEAEISPLLEPLAESLAIAAINGPRNLVLSGENAAMAELVEQLEAQGIDTRTLPVSHAFHSPLVEPAMAAFAECLEEISFSKPTIPMIANIHGNFAGKDVARADYWLQHFRHPVQFAKGMQTLEQKGYRLFIELGPKPVLRSMGQRVLKGESFIWLDTNRQKGRTWANMMHTMATLYTLGVVSDWQGFEQDYPRDIVTIPTYPFQRRSFWPEAALAAQSRKKQATQFAEHSSAAMISDHSDPQSNEVPLPGNKPELPAQHLGEIQALLGNLLQQPATDVDPHKPLFELGVDSIILLDFVRKVEARYAVEITIRQLFEELPTVHAVADFLFESQGPLQRAGKLQTTTPTQPLSAETPPREANIHDGDHRDHIEAQLRETIARLLQMSPEALDPHRPFLELGADSLILIDAVRLIEKDYGVKLAIHQLFEELPNLAAVATHIAAYCTQPVEEAHTSAATPPAADNLSQPTQNGIPQKPSYPNMTMSELVNRTPSNTLSPSQSEALERVIARQLEAMSNLMEGQLAVLESGPSLSSAPSVPIPSEPGTIDNPAQEETLPERAPALPTTRNRHEIASESAGNLEQSILHTPDPYASKPPMVWDKETMQRLATQAKSAQFSLFFFGNYVSEFMEDKYNLLFEAATYADRQGFTAIWFPERHFHEFGGFSPNPSLIAAALAKTTDHIQLRAGSVVLPIHHPVRVVEEWSVVDNLSKGRVGVSFASGWHPNDFIFAPENFENNREKMFSSIEEVRRTWRGKPVTCRNGIGAETELKIFPMPMQPELPVWLTVVHNPDMYIKAGEMGAGILTNLMGQTIEDLRKNIALYRESLAKNGFDPASGHVTVLLHTFITEDAETAREIAREPFCDYLRSSLGLFKGLLKAQKNQVDLDRVSSEDIDYIVQAAYNRYVQTTALIGSVETCAPIMDELLDAGMDEAACFLDFGVDPQKVIENLPHVDALRRRFHHATSAPHPNMQSPTQREARFADSSSVSPVLTAAPVNVPTTPQPKPQKVRGSQVFSTPEVEKTEDLAVLAGSN